jgi:hypothetical protein
MKKKSVCSSRRSGGRVLICTTYLRRTSAPTVFFLRHRHLASTPTNLVLPLTEIGIAENVRER